MAKLGFLLLSLASAQLNGNAQIVTSSDLISSNSSSIVFDDNVSSEYVRVSCEANRMCVTINQAYFQDKLDYTPENLQDFMSQIELDSPCADSNTMPNGDKEMCTTTLGENNCGITMEYVQNVTHVAYKTQIKTGINRFVHPNGTITLYKHNIPFLCTFPLDYLLTLESETGDKYGHYVPKIFQVQIITVLFGSNGGEGIGRFPVTMMLYRDSTYQFPYSAPPTMNVSDTLYFGIALTGDENNRPANSVIQARRCWATPDGNPDNVLTRVNLIDDYCPSTFEDSAQDPTVTILQNGVSNYAKWTAKAFKFAGQEFDKVYIHCWARVCFNVNGQTCDKGNSCGNRKRRAAGSIGLPRDVNGVDLDGVGSDENIDEVVLTVGPILLDDRVRPLGNDGTYEIAPSKSDGFIDMFLDPTVGAIAITSLVIIMLVLVALIVMIVRKQMRNSVTFQKG